MYYILYKKYDTRLSDRPYWKKRLPFEFDSYYEARNWINVCFDEGEWYRQSFEPEYHDCYEEEDRFGNICYKIVYQIRKSREEKKKTLFPDEDLPTIGFRGNSKIIINNGE